jgi:hypothetical protein
MLRACRIQTCAHGYTKPGLSRVLLFRGIGTSNEIHIELSGIFGHLEKQESVLTSLKVEGQDSVIAVERGGKAGSPSFWVGGGVSGWPQLVTGLVFWHQDTIFTPTIIKGGVLRMIEACKGGRQYRLDRHDQGL